MTITMYTFPASQPARAAVMTARVVGVDITLKEIDLFNKGSLSPDFIKINPQHTVPTMDDDGFILWESRAIAAYLVTQYGKDPSLYPKNPQLKAVVDQRLYFDCTYLFPRVRAIVFPAIFLGEKKITEEKKKAVNDAIAFMESFLHGRKWLTGDNVTIADISTYCTFSSIMALGWNIDSFPLVKQWLERCRSLPGAEENEVGAKMLADAVLKNIEPGQI